MHYIYKITNSKNGKIYIGQSKNIKQRWRAHKSAVKNNKPTQIVHRAMIKYEIENFIFEIIASCLDQTAADEAEQTCIKQENSITYSWGYNNHLGGMTAPKTKEWIAKVVATRRAKDNYKHSEETKKKMAEGWYSHRTPETFQKISRGNTGKIISEEQRRKVSEANKGKQFCLGHKQPKEVIEKRIASIAALYGDKNCNAPDCNRTDGYKFNGIRYCVMHIQRLISTGSLELGPRPPPPNKGVPMSDETKQKLSKILKGRPAHNKGKPMAGWLKEKLISLSLGRTPVNKIKFSDEQVQKIISGDYSLEKLAKEFNVSRGTIIRVKKENAQNY